MVFMYKSLDCGLIDRGGVLPFILMTHHDQCKFFFSLWYSFFKSTHTQIWVKPKQLHCWKCCIFVIIAQRGLSQHAPRLRSRLRFVKPSWSGESAVSICERNLSSRWWSNIFINKGFICTHATWYIVDCSQIEPHTGYQEIQYSKHAHQNVVCM